MSGTDAGTLSRQLLRRSDADRSLGGRQSTETARADQSLKRRHASRLGLLFAERINAALGRAVAVAIQQLRGRLSAVARSGSALSEEALFLNDYNRFLELAPLMG